MAVDASDERLKFSAEDFADFICLYENGWECDAFPSAKGSGLHEELVAAAKRLLEMAEAVVCEGKVMRSIEEVYVALDVNVSGWVVGREFWKRLFQCLMLKVHKLEHMSGIASELVCSVEMLSSCIKSGVCDELLEEDNLLGLLDSLSTSGDLPLDEWRKLGHGECLLGVSKLWCERRMAVL